MKFGRLFLCLLLTAQPFALSAQSASPTRAGSPSEPRHVQALHRFGACVARERESDVRELLSLDFRTDRYENLMRRVIRPMPVCEDRRSLAQGFRSGGLLVAGSFAEALLRKDAILDALAERTAFNAAKPVVEARNAGELMAICVVRTDPNGVAQLLRTEAATAQEYQALQAMAPTLSRCVPDGGTARFTREALRAVIGLAAYRLYRNNEEASS